MSKEKKEPVIQLGQELVGSATGLLWAAITCFQNIDRTSALMRSDPELVQVLESLETATYHMLVTVLRWDENSSKDPSG